MITTKNNFVQDKEDDFDWTRERMTASPNTGPSTDHTTGQGYYVYIDASDPQKMGDFATLMSPIDQPTRGACFSFW